MLLSDVVQETLDKQMFLNLRKQRSLMLGLWLACGLPVYLDHIRFAFDNFAKFFISALYFSAPSFSHKLEFAW